jgi:leucyl/phenylalanyl-tRNA--protein transferase
MPIYRLTRHLAFPPVEEAEDGVLAVGGDLRPERLILAYRHGVFPWYHEGIPIIWHSPDPRCVLRLECLHVGATLRKALRKGLFDVRWDSAFPEVIRACSKAPRPGQEGTWITGDMEKAYIKLHELGVAHCVEAWQQGKLVGGLYGVSLGRMFFGESMFSRVDNASKVALVALVERLRTWDFSLVDCQVANAHTLSMGAEEWPRARYITFLSGALQAPTRRGRWTSDEGPPPTSDRDVGTHTPG